MSVLLLILLLALFGLGFLSPVWWVAAAVLVFDLAHSGRRGARGGPHRRASEYRSYQDYRAYRDRQDRWERRYRQQRPSHWDRRDREYHQ
ncbi:hypothetical protein [Streptomyces gobitricini]